MDVMNMSYCRFENTLEALKDCRDALTAAGGWDSLMREASEYEKQAMLSMGGLCEEVVEIFKEMGPYVKDDMGPDM
jgi:hypothetical protein